MAYQVDQDSQDRITSIVDQVLSGSGSEEAIATTDNKAAVTSIVSDAMAKRTGPTSSYLDDRLTSQISKSWEKHERLTTLGLMNKASEDPGLLQTLDNPAYAVLDAMEDRGGVSTLIGSLTGKIFMNPVMKKEISKLVSNTEAFKAFQEMEPDDRLKHLHDLRQAAYEDKYSDVVGESKVAELVSYLYDPSTGLPIGHSVKAGAATIGALAGIDTAAIQKWETGEVDPVTVLAMTAVGTVGGAFLMKGGKMLANKFKDSGGLGDNIPLTGEDLTDQMRLLGISPDDAAYGASEAIAAKLNSAFGANPDTAYESVMYLTNQAIKGKAEEATTYTLERLTQLMIKTGSHLSADQTNTIIDAAKHLKKKVRLDTMAELRIEKGIKPVLRKVGVTAEGKEKYRIIDDPVMGKIAERQQAVVTEWEKLLPRNAKGEIKPEFLEAIGAKKGLLPDEAALAAQRGEAPFASSTLHRDKMISPVHFVPEVDALIKSNSLGSRIQRGIQSYKWMQSGVHYMKRLGNAGREWAARVETSQRVQNHLMQTRTTEMLQALHKYNIGKKGEAQVVDLMRGIVRPSEVSKEVRAAAGAVRKVYDKALDSAINQGIVSKQIGKQLKADKQYFPRVWNRNYLDTAKGKDHFLQVLSAHEFRNQAAGERALSMMIGKDPKYSLVRGLKKNKNGTWSFTREYANLAHKRRDIMSTAKSNHLEKERTFALPDEVLKPFLMNDLKGVTESYLNDVYKRVTTAQYFGNKNEVAASLLARINKEFDGQGNIASEIFLTHIGSAQSKTIQAAMEVPDGLSRALGRLGAFESANLILAQVANIPQATLNGMILVANLSGNPAKMSKVLYGGFQKFLSKAGREEAERSAAAMQNTIMQMQGEMGSAASQFTTGFLKYTMFTWMERQQRLLGASLGRAYVEGLSSDMVKILAKIEKQGPGKSLVAKRKRLQQQMMEMGINPNTPIDKKNPLHLAIDDIDMERASQWFSNEVNFMADKVHKPLLWSSPTAKLFTQFKSYILFQTGFIGRNIIAPAKKGNFLPLAAALGFGILGAPKDQVSRWVRGDMDDVDFLTVENYLNALWAAGALGIWSDMGMNAARGKEALIASFFAGPVISDTAGLGVALYQDSVKALETGKLDLSSTSKEVLSTIIPGAFGRPMAELAVEGDVPKFIEDPLYGFD